MNQAPANRNAAAPVIQAPLNPNVGQNTPLNQNVGQNTLAPQNQNVLAPPNPNDAGRQVQHTHFQVKNQSVDVSPPPMAPVEVWKTAPYCGNFNPGTRHKQGIFNEKNKRIS